jgi:hypothetical protein
MVSIAPKIDIHIACICIVILCIRAHIIGREKGKEKKKGPPSNPPVPLIPSIILPHYL